MSKTVVVRNRRDVQYLRAVAVASVVIYHFWPHRLASGFLGVDVFFVISGFLISSLILREVNAAGNVRLAAFWVRRIRRIFPAAITVIIATAIATNLSGWNSQIVSIGRHIFASAFSFENILLGIDATDYDHRDDLTSPLQHYWSLSVEEQFYIVWPILVICAVWIAKKSNVSVSRILGISIVVIASGSLVYAIVITQGDNVSYFDTLARAWELAIGSGVALWAQRDRNRWRGQLILNRFSWLALVTIFAVPGLNNFAPGIGILPAVIATAFILATGPVPTSRPFPFSKAALLVYEWVGDRSYSIYLWHWPILILSPVFLGYELNTVSKLGAVALILVLAELTYRFVENPVRHARSSWTFRPAIVGSIALLISSAVVATLALTPRDLGKKEPTEDLFAVMLTQPLAASASGPANNFPYTRPYCNGAGAAIFDCPNSSVLEFDASAYPKGPPPSSTCLPEVRGMVKDCVVGDTKSKRRIALVGDSHARAMWLSLDLIGKRAGYAVHEFLTPGCSYRLGDGDWCTKHNREIQTRLNSGEFDLVILAQASKITTTKTQDPQPTANQYRELFGDLKANGITVAVVKDNPKRGPEISSCLIYRGRNPGLCTRSFHPQVDLASQTAIDLGFPIINLDAAYCPDDRCGAVQGGMFMWRDNGHIWPFFHLTAAPLVWSQLMEYELIVPKR